MLLFRYRVLRRRKFCAGVLRSLPLALLVAGCAGPDAARLGAHSVANPVLSGGSLQVPSAVRAPAAPPEVPLFDARKLFDFADTRINESSGAAASRRYPGVLWTHNDSGDSARLFMVALTGANAGETITEVRLDGVSATDWEDMAIAGTGTSAWVYAGDIGDNLRKRSEVVVYRFREPELNIDNRAQTLKIECEKMTLTYPDGAHDAETLIATAGGELIIVTKTASGESVIYKTPQPFAPGTKHQLLRVGEFKFEADGIRSRLTTAGDLSPDGRHLVIRTYTKAYQWTLPENIDWTRGWLGTPQSWTLPETVQGEAICYSADGGKLYTTSEQLPAPLFELSHNS